jgi:ubiquinone/menaquinone biosynthesis C-methylase UbiE
MSSAIEYDQFPYDSHPFPQTHPRHLGALARLFGLESAPIETARILELGCASGGNILPMAHHLPDATFVGVDFSKAQIDQGQRIAAAAGVINARLVHGDIAKLDDTLKNFDYIICHGVYSWVPDRVQQAILDTCRERMAPAGVAYISYNVYPGWHLRGMIRDMMLYHTAAIEDPAQKVSQARALLDFMANHSVESKAGAYRTLLNSELELLRNAGGDYLRHEHLSEDNTSVYFHEFIARAHACGLQYLGESELETMIAGNLPADVQATLRNVAPDIIRMEQYLDFLRNRTFRQTLLTHHETPLIRHLDGATLETLHLSAELNTGDADASTPGASTVGTGGVDANGIRSFAHPNGASVRTGNRDLVGWLDHLRTIWPASVPARQLIDAIPPDNPVLDDGDERKSKATVELMKCICSGVVKLHSAPIAPPAAPSNTPKVPGIVRETAPHNAIVANYLHQPVALDDLARRLVAHLDGETALDTLVEHMSKAVTDGELNVQIDGRAIASEAELRKLMTAAVQERIERLRQRGLLESKLK